MMSKYEAMIIIKPDLGDDERKALFSQIGEAVTRNKGAVSQAAVWAEKRKLWFPIKKNQEGIYYLVNFNAPASAVAEIRNNYKLNENILRTLITRVQ
jgi:small subunit ribosomal protein S6